MDLFTKKQWIALGVTALLAALGVGLGIVSASSGALEVHFFDIGQGDSIFIQTPNRAQVLVDGGPSNAVLGKLEKTMPFYDRHIDLVVATHMDGDHIGGLVPVVKNFEIGGIIVSTKAADTPLSKTFWKQVNQKDIPVMIAGAGDSIKLDQNIRMDILSPGNALSKSAGDNDVSLVAKLRYKEDSFLLTGDIERRAELALVTGGADLRADVLKVAHHGSNSSSNPLFLEKVKPKVAVIQVGKNSFGHPRKVVLERLKGIKILRNDANGDIIFYSKGNSI